MQRQATYRPTREAIRRRANDTQRYGYPQTSIEALSVIETDRVNATRSGNLIGTILLILVGLIVVAVLAMWVAGSSGTVMAVSAGIAFFWWLGRPRCGHSPRCKSKQQCAGRAMRETTCPHGTCRTQRQCDRRTWLDAYCIHGTCRDENECERKLGVRSNRNPVRRA